VIRFGSIRQSSQSVRLDSFHYFGSLIRFDSIRLNSTQFSFSFLTIISARIREAFVLTGFVNSKFEPICNEKYNTLHTKQSLSPIAISYIIWKNYRSVLLLVVNTDLKSGIAFDSMRMIAEYVRYSATGKVKSDTKFVVIIE
jgi:hypothetical protein